MNGIRKIHPLRFLLQSGILLMPFFVIIARAQAHADSVACPLIKISVERLADLNIPRSAHNLFCVNGEVTVVGGHTTNFIPTSTAEYYKDGKWHLMETAYPHDNGLCVVLSSGKVIIAGGHEKPLGIGQTYPAEEYDPITHTFRGFSCLDTKRSLASASEIDSGRVVVAGNWYADDAIEVFNGDRTFSFVKKPSVDRTSPYILRTAVDNVLILGSQDTHGFLLGTDMVDRFRGEPFHVPLLEKWQPLSYIHVYPNNLGFIGNEALDDYTHLLALQDKGNFGTLQNGVHREMAFALVRDTTFTLLPTRCPVPTTGPYGDLHFSNPLITDREAHRGYLVGNDIDNRIYVLCIEYNKRPAPLTLYYTDPLPEAGWISVLTDEGDLMLVGGYNINKSIGGNLDKDNFSPLSSVYLLHLAQNTSTSNRSWGWLWLLLPVAVLLLASVFGLLWLRKKRRGMDAQSTSFDQSDSEISNLLMLRIIALMEQQQVYLNQNLKLNDVAVMLNTNRNIISNCINSQKGISFSQFVSNYRVVHAQKLMRQQPDLKITEVWMRSGFSSESAFFRSFKTSTGMTPSEWKENNHQS